MHGKLFCRHCNTRLAFNDSDTTFAKARVISFFLPFPAVFALTAGMVFLGYMSVETQRAFVTLAVIGTIPFAIIAPWFACINVCRLKQYLTKVESEAAVAEAAGYSGPTEHFHSDLREARQAANAGRYLTFGAVLWAWLNPFPYRLVIGMLVGLPWLALIIAARSPGLVTLNEKKKDVRAGLGAVLILPGLALSMRCLIDYSFVRLGQLHAFAIAATLVIFVIAMRVDPRLREGRGWVVLIPLLTPYGYGSAVMYDALLDRSQPKVFQTTVLSKRITSGSGAHPEFTIAPWGPEAKTRKVAVNRYLFDEAAAGSVVCVHERQGALSVPWFQVDSCP